MTLNNYWQSIADQFKSREVLSPTHGDEEVVRELMARYAEINSYYGGGPPACTELPCPDEDHFDAIDLPVAAENLIRDIAMSLGFEIGEVKKYEYDCKN